MFSTPLRTDSPYHRHFVLVLSQEIEDANARAVKALEGNSAEKLVAGFVKDSLLCFICLENIRNSPIPSCDFGHILASLKINIY